MPRGRTRNGLRIGHATTRATALAILLQSGCAGPRQVAPVHATHGARAGSEATASPTVAFNHLYVVVPAQVMEQFLRASLLRDRLAAADRGFPKFEPVEPGSQSIYLRGRHTYLEILGPNNRFDEPVGKLGLAFSTDSVGEVEEVEKRLREATAVAWARHLTQWDFDRDPPVNWYHVVYRPFAAEARCAWWFSEYHPDFLPALYPDRPAGRTGVERSRFLAGHHDETRWLRDIVSLRVVLEPAAADQLAADLTAVGWTIEDGDDGEARGRRRISGPEFEIALHTPSNDEAHGLRTIGFTTYTQADGPQQHELPGGVTVRLDGAGLGWLELGS